MRVKSQNVTSARLQQRRCPFPAGTAAGNGSCISAGAAYRIRGIDLGAGGKITDKWSVFGGLVLMQSEVTKSLVPPAQPLAVHRPTSVCRSPTSRISRSAC